MKEIIIDGVTYEIRKKNNGNFTPSSGDFIIYTQPAFNNWIVYKVLFFKSQGKRVGMVSENEGGFLCVENCTIGNFNKKYEPYNGQEGAHYLCEEWWERETNNQRSNK
jgi:hypothetical protein